MFGTILGYNFLKYASVLVKGKFFRLKYLGIIIICLLCSYGFYFFIIRLLNGVKLQLLLGVWMVLIYPSLRKHGVLKMFWVSFVIAYLTAFVFLNALPTPKEIVALEFLKRFFFVCALMIPFEIYDSQHDEKTLNTLPQKYGIATAKKWGWLFLLLFVVLDIVRFVFLDKVEILKLSIDIFIAALTGIAIVFSNVDRSRYYTAFWVEGIPVLWFVLLLFFG